jgi:hypothetical protein
MAARQRSQGKPFAVRRSPFSVHRSAFTVQRSAVQRSAGAQERRSLNANRPGLLRFEGAKDPNSNPELQTLNGERRTANAERRTLFVASAIS